MSRIGIFGTSGMAREVGDIAWELGLEPVYVARDQGELDACGLLGQVILESDVDRNTKLNYVIGIGDNGIRHRIALSYGTRLKFVNLIHPSASFGKGQRELLEAKRGVIVCPGVRFTNNITVGDFCIFNLNSTVSHDVVFDECVFVAPGAHITGNVHIGPRVWVGAGVVINQGKASSKRRIGADTTIGSGAVVVENCESNAVYVGIPARQIK